MKCVCNSLSLTFYDKTTLSDEEIEKYAITINENDPNFNKAYTIDCQGKKFEEVNEFFDKLEKNGENKPNIIITNDEFLI